MKSKEKLRYLHKHYKSTTVETKRLFNISHGDFFWKNRTPDDPSDLCLHSYMTVTLPNVKLEYDCCISAAVFSLLKTLTRDHKMGTFSQLMPCCGYNYHFDKHGDVNVSGCENGIDFNVTHQRDDVLIELAGGESCSIPFFQYSSEILSLAREVKGFYISCVPKDDPNDVYIKKAYDAFWVKYQSMMDNALGLYSDELFVISLHSTHKRNDVDTECGEPHDSSQHLRRKYVSCCTKSTLNGYIERDFGNNLTVVYEDKYDDAAQNEVEFVESCLKSTAYNYKNFNWHYEDETYGGVRHIWHTSYLDVQRLFKKIILSELGQETQLSYAVYIINNNTGEVFFPYDDRGYAYFTV